VKRVGLLPPAESVDEHDQNDANNDDEHQAGLKHAVTNVGARRYGATAPGSAQSKKRAHEPRYVD
jgi:hypothetical protein